MAHTLFVVRDNLLSPQPVQGRVKSDPMTWVSTCHKESSSVSVRPHLSSGSGPGSQGRPWGHPIPTPFRPRTTPDLGTGVVPFRGRPSGEAS